MSTAITLTGIDQVQAKLERLRNVGKSRAFFEMLGGLVESQTHDRLRNEKTSPDGKKWEEWSDDYADTRHSGQSLLMSEGHLDDSLQFAALDTSVIIGSNLVYAAAQNDGYKGIPAREYLGVSTANVSEIVHALNRWYDRVMS